MFGCESVASILASRANRSSAFSSPSRRVGSTLTATSRSSWWCRARYTSPMPPAPSGARISYAPIRLPVARAMGTADSNAEEEESAPGHDAVGHVAADVLPAHVAEAGRLHHAHQRLRREEARLHAQAALQPLHLVPAEGAGVDLDHRQQPAVLEDAVDLLQAARLVLPVVDAVEADDLVERLVLEVHRLGRALDVHRARHDPLRPLEHAARRLQQHAAAGVLRVVLRDAARPRADLEDVVVGGRVQE